MNIETYYKKCKNHKCIICDKLIRLEEVMAKTSIITITKRGSIKLAHKNCINGR